MRAERNGWQRQYDAAHLREVFDSCLSGRELIVVSNRQPYAHHRAGDGRVSVQVSPGGLVTALEPLLNACAGVWVAHGGGSADRDFVDEWDRVGVPPACPNYKLRRVWINPAEFEGYYSGFANAGLWPLFHKTAVKPRFTGSGWKFYKDVNRHFARAVIEEISTDNPLIMVQDYHLALLPGLLRAKVPLATIVVFWHIPWPEHSRVELCPWQPEIIRQMLAADILGFNIQEHCNNFMLSAATVHSSLEGAGEDIPRSRVAAYPESIEWSPEWLQDLPSISSCRRLVRCQYGLAEDVRLGLGVDRWDFTKGIPERLLAFEMLLEMYPGYCGTVVLLQIAAPTRTEIPEYAALQDVSRREVDRINKRFATDKWTPIVFVAEQRSKSAVYTLYRSADFCVVNSLHDGMNLVSKEFVSSRDDDDGVLILSKMAGAANELEQALQIDPTNLIETTVAFRSALEMRADERRARMTAMRATVRKNNVYRWAACLLEDAAKIRHESKRA